MTRTLTSHLSSQITTTAVRDGDGIRDCTMYMSSPRFHPGTPRFDSVMRVTARPGERRKERTNHIKHNHYLD
eukprot:2432178-Prymnesium_polylepis.1